MAPTFFGVRFKNMSIAGLRAWGHARRLDDQRQEAISTALSADSPGEFAPYLYRLATLMALSTVIASLGLIANSAAVVIGAMLVAPLMQPILAFSSGLVHGEPRRQLIAFGLIVAATIEGLGVAVAVAAVVPSFRAVTVTPEILSRTAPGVLDLAIAIAAGCAGAYVTIRRQSSGALPGAAIAVALIPPLSASGLLLERGYTSLAKGALLLFLTNLLGIALSAAAVFILTGYVPRRRVGVGRMLGLLIPLALMFSVTYPLSRQSATAYRRTQDEAKIRGFLVPVLRASGLGLQTLSVIEGDNYVTASVDVIGPQRPPPPDVLARPLAETLHRPVTLILRWTQRDEQIAASGSDAGR